MKEEGLITNNDVLRSELQLSNDRISLKRTENSIILASQQLDILLGLDEQLLIVPDTSALRPALLDETFETCLMKAYDADPSVRLARQRVALAENEVKIACSDYFPTISLYAGKIRLRDRSLGQWRTCSATSFISPYCISAFLRPPGMKCS